jgi:hypothetical protein
MAEEKKLTQQYTVMHFSDGTVEVKDALVDGTEEMTVEKIYDDIVSLSTFIERQRSATLAYNAGYQAALKFMQDLQARQQAAATPEGETDSQQ